MKWINGRRHDPGLCDKDFLFLRRLSQSLAQARDQHVAGHCPGIMLDVGSTWKPYEPVFRTAVGRFMAIDYENIEGHNMVAAGSADALPVRDESADAVLCTQVLEHVDEPDAVLGELARVLRPGGVVLMSTHGVFHHHPYPHDYWRWTHEGLTRIMSRHFERPKIYAQGGTMLLMAHLMGRGVYSVAGKRWWLRWLRYTAYPVVNLMGLLLDRMVPDQSVSINYLVVAWKPAVGSARAAGG